MELVFFGAAGEVTGSCHILKVNGRQVLLDCGMIQGSRKAQSRNRDPFPFDPSEIDAVVLSHAHIDHSGRLPLLVKRGYGGPIYTHNASRDLCRILLRDSAYLITRDVALENRRRERKGLPSMKALFSMQDAEEAIDLLTGMRYSEEREVGPGVTIRFQDAGHIMGAAIVELRLSENGLTRKLVFSGDLGQYGTPVLRDPSRIPAADLVLMESTYGGRVHRDRRLTVEEIGEIIQQAAHDRGNILIPAFAVGRSQEILYLLGKHFDEWGLDRWRIFLDSPMAIAASRVYWDYPHLYDEEATKLRRELDTMPPLPNLHLTESAEGSQRINKIRNGAIVIAGSGMCNGGRIVHHLRHNVWRKEAHVMIVGYQAEGSLGRRLVDGAEYVRIFGEAIRVAAQIHTVGGLSAHGDSEDLAKWYRGFDNTPPVYLVHGEPAASQAFKNKLETECGATVSLTHPGLTIDLADMQGHNEVTDAGSSSS